jgi:alpha-amylase/alpha-mannosidase (GH57 family)
MKTSSAKKPLELGFLWHMHQPDYRDENGVIRMPWVFLHAIKDYYDMPWMLSKFPQLKASFNLTPPLIEQLKLYKEPLKHDYFLMLWHRDPDSLEKHEKEWLVKTCKSANYDTMVRPLPRYCELYDKAEMERDELIDLEMLFLLSWCGPYLRLNNTLVKRLLQQGSAYTCDDKRILLDILVRFVSGILPFYGRLLKRGQIALSTTPYNHPILPLLIDMKNVIRANENTPMPKDPLSMKEDAIEQVRRAVELYKETFGEEPVGFWPAEGAVDEESVEIYKSFGIQWIATDEAILFKSLKNQERSVLYHPYDFRGLHICFRDHALSDLLGFDYRFKAVEEAVGHFSSQLSSLFEKDAKSVFVILDGENAWEYYEQNGYPFFMALYEKLSEDSWCTTVTLDEVAQQESIPLEHLVPGSWIWGDFSTWAGHPEKNRAWELIFQTKRDVQKHAAELPPKIAEKITFHFLAAECSDWFWWYGDDHMTDFAQEFDTLFRQHLINIYELLDITTPSNLFTPIIEHHNVRSSLLEPQAHIYPMIDGRRSSFFEWIGCGIVDEKRIFSTMDRVRGPIEKIRFGHNDTMVFVAFEGEIERLKNASLVVVVEELSKTIHLPLSQTVQVEGIQMRIDTMIEIAIPRSLFDELSTVHLSFELEEEGKILQTLPGFGALEMDLDEDYSRHWYI